jgi:hypothetical protein
VAAALLAAASAFAAGGRKRDPVVQMYEIGCTAPPPAALAALPPDWLAHHRQVERCPVYSEERVQALTLETVRVPRGSRPAAPLPLPRLLDLSGRLVGVLPAPWPGLDVDMTPLYFKQWRNDVPERIEMLFLSAPANTLAVSTTTYPPLLWNKARRVYEVGR